MNIYNNTSSYTGVFLFSRYFILLIFIFNSISKSVIVVPIKFINSLKKYSESNNHIIFLIDKYKVIYFIYLTYHLV